MSDKTTNLGLIKPDGEDYFDIRHFNENSDITDEEIGSLKSRMTEAEEAIEKIDDITVDWERIENKPESYTPAEHSHSWEEVSDKPTEYTPEAHTHTVSDVSGILPVTKGGTGATTAKAALTSLGALQCQTGSYTGTGLWGEDNAISLTFDFKPRLFMLCTDVGLAIAKTYYGSVVLNVDAVPTSYTDKVMSHSGTTSGGTTYYCKAKKSTDGKTLSWYFPSLDTTADMSSHMFNEEGVTYTYLAIG